MKIKTLALLVLVAAAFWSANSVFAMTPQEKAALIAQIQQQIAQISEAIAQLMATDSGTAQQNVAPSGEETGSGGGAQCYYFDTNLRQGDSGPAIAYLQSALTSEGFAITADEFQARFFGGSTLAAVNGFQLKYKSEVLAPYGLNLPTGKVAKSTRAKLNKLFDCSNPDQGQRADSGQPSVVATCSPRWNCSWSDCANGYRSRVCYDENGCGTLAPAPESQACGTAQAQQQSSGQQASADQGAVCFVNWVCTPSACSNGSRTVTCIDANNCGRGPITQTQTCSATAGSQTVSTTIDIGSNQANSSSCIVNWTCTYSSCVNSQRTRTCIDANNCGHAPITTTSACTTPGSSSGSSSGGVAACTPNCSGRQCGSLNGCGGSCGACPAGQYCDIQGWNTGTLTSACKATVTQCTPDCRNKNCGGDGCGGSCGACPAGQTCSSGVCFDSANQYNYFDNTNAYNVQATCNSLGYNCGLQHKGDGTLINCGTCPSDQACEAGRCLQANNCQDIGCAAAGRQCGEYINPCGRKLTCGTCSGGQACNAYGKCQSGLNGCTQDSDCYNRSNNQGYIKCDTLNYVCYNPSETRCTSNANCSANQKCDTATGKCVACGIAYGNYNYVPECGLFTDTCTNTVISKLCPAAKPVCTGQKRCIASSTATTPCNRDADCQAGQKCNLIATGLIPQGCYTPTASASLSCTANTTALCPGGECNLNTNTCWDADTPCASNADCPAVAVFTGVGTAYNTVQQKCNLTGNTGSPYGGGPALNRCYTPPGAGSCYTNQDCATGQTCSYPMSCRASTRPVTACSPSIPCPTGWQCLYGRETGVGYRCYQVCSSLGSCPTYTDAPLWDCVQVSPNSVYDQTKACVPRKVSSLLDQLQNQLASLADALVRLLKK